jgi:mono/diheme cytochrome c family protein
MKRLPAIVAAVTFCAALGAWAAAEIPEGVKSVFQKRCASCHKGVGAPKGLSWETDKIAKALDAASREVPGLKIIDTKMPEASYLLKKVRRESGIAGKPMPPGKALAAEELQALEAWIAGLK